MLAPLDVQRPLDRVGVLRPGDDEQAVARETGGFDQKLVDKWLTVVAVGAEIAEVPAIADLGLRFLDFRFRVIQLGVH